MDPTVNSSLAGAARAWKVAAVCAGSPPLRQLLLCPLPCAGHLVPVNTLLFVSQAVDCPAWAVLVHFLKNIEMNYPCHKKSGGPQWKEGA